MKRLTKSHKKKEAVKRKLEKKVAKKQAMLLKKKVKAEAMLTALELTKNEKEKMLAAEKENTSFFFVQRRPKLNKAKLQEKLRKKELKQLKKEYKFTKVTLKTELKRKIKQIKLMDSVTDRQLQHEQACFEYLHKIETLKKEYRNKEEYFQLNRLKNSKKKAERIEKLKTALIKKQKNKKENFCSIFKKSLPSKNLHHNKENALQKLKTSFKIRRLNIDINRLSTGIKRLRTNAKRLNNHFADESTSCCTYQMFSESNSPLLNLSETLKDARTLAVLRCLSDNNEALSKSVDHRMNIIECSSNSQMEKGKKPTVKLLHPQLAQVVNRKASKIKSFRLKKTELRSEQKKKLNKKKRLNAELIYQLDIERENRVYAQEQAFKAERSCQEYQQKALTMEKEYETQRVKQRLRFKKSVTFKAETKKLLNEKQKEIFALKTQLEVERKRRVIAETQAVEAERSCEQYRKKMHAMENEFDLRTRHMINQQRGIINEFEVNRNAFTTEKDIKERLTLSEKENNRKDELLLTYDSLTKKETRVNDLITSVDQKMVSLDKIIAKYRAIKARLDERIIRLEFFGSKQASCRQSALQSQ